MISAIIMDAKCSKFQHSIIVIIDDNDAGNNKIINNEVKELRKKLHKP